MITSSENGYYFLYGDLIYYMDKDSMKPVLLDNRPDHRCFNEPDSQNCYAFVEKSDLTPPNFIQYFDSHLYVLESYWNHESTSSMFNDVWKLTRLAPDGKNRKVIKTFDTQPGSVAIHRGYLYYTTESAGKDNLEQMDIVRMSLQGDMKEDVLYSKPEDIDIITDVLPYGNQLYWLVLGEKRYFVQGYDLSSGEVSGNYEDSRNLNIYASNLLGEQIEEVEIEHPPVLSNFYQDESYSYIRPDPAYVPFLLEGALNELAVYKDGMKVHQLNLSSLFQINKTVVGDDRYMFTFDGTVTGGSRPGLLYLDKSKIESGEAEFIPLIEME